VHRYSLNPIALLIVSWIPVAAAAGVPGLETVAPGGTRAPAELRQPLALSPTVSFEGIQQTLFTPPSPDIAAGPEDLILVVNSSIARYTKEGQQTSLQTLQQWFATLVPAVCANAQTCGFRDASVRYDSIHGRFLLLALSEDTCSCPTSGRTYFVLSVSNGATFGGGWKHWSLEARLNNTTQTALEADFPRLGYDNTAIYLTANMVATGVVQYAKVRILKKSELYNPDTVALTYRDIWDLNNEDNTNVSSLHAPQLRGRVATAASAGLLVNASTTANADSLTLWRIENPTSTAPTAARTTIRGIWNYSSPQPAAQLGGTVQLDTGDARILRGIVRNGILYTARNTGYLADLTTVTYDRIDLNLNLVTLQSRLTNGNFFYPAFDVPASHGPSNTFPNKLIVGTTTDANGSLTYAGITDVKAGEDAFDAGNKWGKYFGGAVDPVQGGLWVYGEYAKAKSGAAGRWGTWASYFPPATSPQFADVPNSSAFYDSINIMRLWSITSGCTATDYCPASPVTRGQMAVFIIRALFGDSFTIPNVPYFTDVPATHPLFSYIQKMRELGITSGCTATTFCPDSNVTRGEMAVFLVRGKLASLHQDNFPFPQPVYFTDVPGNHVFHKFVQKLRELGITSGCGATTYCPDSPVTRDQMATFIVRSFLN
jgi:hypothetical protein